MPVSADSRIGTELAGYRIEALIGRGGMGVVYRAHDLALDRDVALKLLAPHLAADVSFRERFLKESRVAASLEHPNVVPIHDAGEIDGQLYIVMRLVEGSDLKAVLREGPLDPARAVIVLQQIAGALDAAHTRGLVHRDVKPSNVLVTEDGHAYLADFGLTRRLSDQAAGFDAGLSLGTPDYVSPEQIEGKEVDGRADQYSLACLLHETLTGAPPFPRASEAATLFAHLEEAPPSPPGLEAVLSKALAKDPDERFQACAELIEAARIRLGLSKPGRSLWPAAAAVVGLAVVAAALLAFFLARGGSGSTAGRGGSLVRIDPTTNEPEDAIWVGTAPSSVSASPDGVWIADYRGSALWRVNPRTLAVAEVPANGAPQDVAMYRGTAYVAANGPTEFAGNVTKYAARSGRRIASLDLPSCVKSVVAGSLGVWGSPCPTVAHVSLDAKPKVLRTIIPPFPTTRDAAHDRETLNDMALGMGSVWVIGDALDPRVWRIDPRSGRIATLARLPGTFAPYRVAAGAGSVWVTDQLNDRVARVDPVTGRVVASIAVGDGAGGIAVGAGSVWVANTLEGTLSRIDPDTNRVVATIRVPGRPKDVSFGAGSVWAVGDAT
jgi:YVTN family beta-propeller protein